MTDIEFGPLQAASVDDLWDEIARRHSSAVLTYTRMAKENNDSQEVFLLYSGGATSCLGLAARASRRLEDICVDPGDDEPDRGW